MSVSKSKDYIRLMIREAFKDEKKGGRMGPREIQALDDRFSYAVGADVEENWWDFPDSLKGSIAENLCHADDESVRFLLPAAITATLDGLDHSNGLYVYFKLCTHHPKNNFSRGLGTQEYVDYLRTISPPEIAASLCLTPKQMSAVGAFLAWWFQKEGPNQLIDPRQGNTVRSSDLQVEIAIYEEELRIINAWIRFQK